MEILIVGLGAIGHSMVSSITNKEVKVDTVTTNGDTVKSIENNLGNSFKIRNNYTYENLPKYDYDFIIITLPYRQKISRIYQIEDKISPKSTIVITPANQCVFYYLPKKIQEQNNFILLERVPQISRVNEKNKSVNVLGTRTDLRYATKGNVNIEEFINIYSYLKDMVRLPHIDDISLISSNATIHTVRLYNLFKDNNNFDKDIAFYKDWTLEDAELFIMVENEIIDIANQKAILENRKNNVYDMYTHFKIDPITKENVKDKISNNPSLNKIIFKVKDKNDLIENRYFYDDILIGIYSFIQLGKKLNVKTTNLEMIYNWALTLSNPADEIKQLNI